MEVPSRLRDLLGDERYYKFLSTLHSSCREKGRLMFWQEKALNDFRETRHLTKRTVDELCSILPLEHPPQPSNQEVAENWVSFMRLHGIREFDERMEISRYVSKIGELSSDEHILRLMAPFLTQDEIVELYQQIINSGRLEVEWRGEFIDIFRIKEDVLPEMQVSQAEADEIHRSQLVDMGVSPEDASLVSQGKISLSDFPAFKKANESTDKSIPF